VPGGPVRRRVPAQTEHASERVALSRLQLVDPGLNGCSSALRVEKPRSARNSTPDARRTRKPPASSQALTLVQQRRLADPRLSRQHQAGSVQRRVSQEVTYGRQLLGPADQQGRR
jgi:hypothetical protein